MKIKRISGLFLGGFLLSTACNSRSVDDGAYMSGPEGAATEATATDQAETASVTTDSTRIILNSPVERNNME